MHQDILTIVVEGSAKDDNCGVAENEGRRPIDQYLQS